MKFVEVREGLSIDLDKIEAVERLGQFSCKIFTTTTNYVADFPYQTMLKALEAAEKQRAKDLQSLAINKYETFNAV